MSLTVTTNGPSTINIDGGNDGQPLILRLRGYDPAADSGDIGNKPNNGNSNNDIEALLDKLGIPEGLKDMFRKVFSQGGGDSQNLPSEASAVNTMQKFQQNGGPGLISYDQMKGIADGSIKEMNGKEVTPEVREAAKAYVANNGALFDKVENATDGKHDSQLGAGDPDHLDRSTLSNQPTQAGTGPSSFLNACANGHVSPNNPEEYDAVKTMADFQKNGGPGLISYDQMKGIADGSIKELNGKEITPEVKEAAQAYVANNGALFDKIESATDGKHDSQLGAGDPEQALKKGIVDVPPMSEKQAVAAFEDFQKNGGPGLISYDQMKGVADGSIKELNGKEITPELKAAAQAYVANNGALFDKMEAATDGKHDSQLGAGDPEQARNKGVALSDQAPAAAGGNNGGYTITIDPTGGNGNGNGNGNNGGYTVNIDPGRTNGDYGQNPPTNGMSKQDAVETVEKFQKDGGPGLISYDQMKGIADGSIKELNGKEITPDMKEAAKTYVANNGALFDKMEASTDGKHDSQLGAGDPKAARAKGELGMSDEKAVSTIEDFQKRTGIGKLSQDEMKEMSEGKFHGFPVSADLKLAAQQYMKNNGELFDKVESATDGQHDSMLGAGDPEKAREKDLIRH